MRKVHTGYVIKDNITNEYLESYDKNQLKWQWTNVGYENAINDDKFNEYIQVDIHIFSTKRGAKKAIKHLSEVFSKNGDRIDFKLCKTTRYELISHCISDIEEIE